jgi:hypothetical protein
MSFFSLSDLIIACTLCANALVLLAPSKPLNYADEEFSQPASSQSIVGASVAQYLMHKLSPVRVFSGIILLWNSVFFVLVVFIFNKD